MKDIDYAAPKTVAEAVALLNDKGDRARILAGGTDIIVQLREHRRDLDLLVDVKNIPEVNDLSYDAKQGLRLIAIPDGSPSWATSDNAPPASGPALAGYTQFVTQAIARYGTNGTFWAQQASFTE